MGAKGGRQSDPNEGTKWNDCSGREDPELIAVLNVGAMDEKRHITTKESETREQTLFGETTKRITGGLNFLVKQKNTWNAPKDFFMSTAKKRIKSPQWIAPKN